MPPSPTRSRSSLQLCSPSWRWSCRRCSYPSSPLRRPTSPPATCRSPSPGRRPPPGPCRPAAAAQPGAFALTTLPDPAAGDRALRDREVYQFLSRSGRGEPCTPLRRRPHRSPHLLVEAARRLRPAAGTGGAVVPADPDDPRGTGFAAGFLPFALASPAGRGAAHPARRRGPPGWPVLAYAVLWPGSAGVAVLQGWLGVMAGDPVRRRPDRVFALALAATVTGLGALLGRSGIGLGALLLFLVGNSLRLSPPHPNCCRGRGGTSAVATTFGRRSGQPTASLPAALLQAPVPGGHRWCAILAGTPWRGCSWCCSPRGPDRHRWLAVRRRPSAPRWPRPDRSGRRPAACSSGGVRRDRPPPTTKCRSWGRMCPRGSI